MIRLWRELILPVFKAAQVKTILEIGAESGKSTSVLMNYVAKHNGHLYCIDPAPEFDSDELKRDYPDNLTFYENLSLNVLPEHERFDVALVDGDHNWYTVYNELKLIEEIHQHNPLHQPIIFVHDIGWPYGRRDLYYDPSTIPKEFRQDYARKGILPKRSELSPDSGMNIDNCNACHEGGERNGVLTAVEDYLSESALQYHFTNIPLYFGLGILITEQRIAANMKLKTLIEELEGEEGSKRMLHLAEHLRAVDLVFAHVVAKQLQVTKERVAVLEKHLEDTRNGKPMRDGDSY